MRHNGEVPQPDAPARPFLSPEDAARLRRRYPKSRLSGPWGILLVVVVGAALLGWTLWAGLQYATPAVAAQVRGFQATSDNTATVQVDVQRADTTRPAVCTLTVVGTNAIPVGETDVRVEAGGATITTVAQGVRTTGRALSANVTNCRIP